MVLLMALTRAQANSSPIQKKEVCQSTLLTRLIANHFLPMDDPRCSTGDPTLAPIDLTSVLLMDASQKYGSITSRIIAWKNILMLIQIPMLSWRLTRLKRTSSSTKNRRTSRDRTGSTSFKWVELLIFCTFKTFLCVQFSSYRSYYSSLWNIFLLSFKSMVCAF